MQLAALTRSSVLQAMEEFRAATRDKFLSNNGFRRARDYFVLHDGHAYDSKAIAGVAFRIQTGLPRRSGDFTGGRGVADRMRELGFDVVQVRDWELEETVLVCDVLCSNAWMTIPEADQRIVELSRLLRTQWDFAPYLEELRSTNSVHHKLEDLRTARPGHPGKIKKGGDVTASVAAAFHSEPSRMHALALELRAAGRLSALDQDEHEQRPVGELTPAELASAAEGRIIRRLVSVRERDPRLRQRKIEQSRLNRGAISCEVCDFDFEKSYPTIGDGYIQVHHVVPLHFSGEVQTMLKDLALVCANCHQMMHRGRPDWLTPAELRRIIRPRLD